eukprot:TRINITY_DN25130_c0_g1_i1.p1 TRINITY_DN25130_c0_g1~~TRINITY_DN25130_c0_g1_i1.p1  ORF type:complete len:107 (+),score=21.26 TRINITY_DN25130_c0_g1_i1:225-545(+)
MAKSIRSKRKKRLRTLRREISEKFYDSKEQAKLAAQAAALAAPKVQVRSQMDIQPEGGGDNAIPMAIDGSSGQEKTLKPVGGIKKQSSKNLRLKKRKHKRKHKKRH